MGHFVKKAAKELETALAVPGHGPTAFDALWNDVSAAEPRIAVFDFIGTHLLHFLMSLPN